MVRTVLIFFLLLVLILCFLFGVVKPIFSKKTEEPIGDLDSLDEEADKVLEASKKARSKVNKADKKVSEIKNKLNN